MSDWDVSGGHGLLPERQALTVQDLSAGYGGAFVLHRVSFSLEAGSVTGLWGLNGAGKSTLLSSLMGQVTKTGTITLNGKDITRLPTHQVVRQGMTLVPEGRHVFPHMSVRENLEIGGYIQSRSRKHKENLERVFERFPLLKERASQLAGSLSGGEQQLLAIGRGLMSGATLLLIDEPFLGLSPSNTETVTDAIRSIQSSGVAVLLAEEKLAALTGVTQHIVTLDQGRLGMQPDAPSFGVAGVSEPSIISNVRDERVAQQCGVPRSSAADELQ